MITLIEIKKLVKVIYGIKMKILLLQETDWIKRNPHQQHHLMERLSLRGHDIRVIDVPINWKGLFKKRDLVDGYHKIHPGARIRLIRPGFLNLPVLTYFSIIHSHYQEIKKQVTEFKPDVIIGFGIINSYLASQLARKEKIPFIYYWIDVLHKLIPEKYLQLIGEYLERLTIKNSSQVITINRKLEEFVKKLGARNTQVIGAGIDLGRFNPDLDGSQIRKNYEIEKEDKIIFFMGFLYHFTGLKEVILEIARGKYEDLKLLIVGDGEAYADLKNIVKKHDLEDKVLLVGPKPYQEIPEFLAAADVCILPAYPQEEIMQDIVPIKIYEYMAMGKPVITTNLPGVMKEFGNKNGITYVNEPSDVLGRAYELDLDPEGNRARKFVEDNDWVKITDEFETTLSSHIGLDYNQPHITTLRSIGR